MFMAIALALVMPTASMARSNPFIEVNLKTVHPTQFTAGMREVDRRAAKLRALSNKELLAYLNDHPAQVVRGPGDEYYLVDKHHLALAALKIGLDEIPGELIKDLSSLSAKEFWKKMKELDCVYLSKQGNGPLSPEDLPRTLDQMTDDIYVSVASFVRRAGGFRKVMRHFSGFDWAEFFRAHLKIGKGDRAFNAAVTAGLALAKSPLAKDIPGYLGCQADLVK
jgi:hypothetical protein